MWEKYLRRLGVGLAWACFIISCALWIWAESPRGPSGSVPIYDPDFGGIPKPPTVEEQAQMDAVNKEFACLLAEAKAEKAGLVEKKEVDIKRGVLAIHEFKRVEVEPSVALVVKKR